MNFRRKDTPSAAAAKASFSTATAYRIESDPQPPSQKQPPRSRRRSDPLDGIFEKEVVPLLVECPALRAVTIFEDSDAPPSSKAPCQRAPHHRAPRAPVARPAWARTGGDLRPEESTRRLGLSDFTATGDLGVTSAVCRDAFAGTSGCPTRASNMRRSARRRELRRLERRLPERLVCSVRSRKSTVPTACRPPATSIKPPVTISPAATRSCATTMACAPRATTAARPTRTAASKAPTATSKRAIEQALLLRGSRDFDDLAAYRAFIAEIQSPQRCHRARIAPNAPLGPLPVQRSGLRAGARPGHRALRLHSAQGVLLADHG